MSKSCWSLPTDDGSAGEDAAALQAILNGYMAAVPMRIAEHAENFAERYVCYLILKYRHLCTGEPCLL